MREMPSHLEIVMKQLFCLILLALSTTATAHHEAGIAEDYRASAALLLMMLVFLIGSITITVQSYRNKPAGK